MRYGKIGEEGGAGQSDVERVYALAAEDMVTG